MATTDRHCCSAQAASCTCCSTAKPFLELGPSLSHRALHGQNSQRPQKPEEEERETVPGGRTLLQPHCPARSENSEYRTKKKNGQLFLETQPFFSHHALHGQSTQNAETRRRMMGKGKENPQCQAWATEGPETGGAANKRGGESSKQTASSVADAVMTAFSGR